MRFHTLLPLVLPEDLTFQDWDVLLWNMAEAMQHVQVLDWRLQEQLWPHLLALHLRLSVYTPEFIEAN